MTPAQLSMSQALPNGTDDTADRDADCWREAARLRSKHSGWIVIWLASTCEYRAYRLSQAQRNNVLTAQAPEDLDARIRQAEQASGTPLAARRRDRQDHSGPVPATRPTTTQSLPSTRSNSHD